MAKMNELSQVLDDLVSCGEGMIRAANALREIFSASVATEEPVLTTMFRQSFFIPASVLCLVLTFTGSDTASFPGSSGLSKS